MLPFLPSGGFGTSIGKFDGNGLTIYGLALSETSGISTNFGLFASVTIYLPLFNFSWKTPAASTRASFEATSSVTSLFHVFKILNVF